MEHSAIVGQILMPVIVLVAWSLLILVVLYVRRIPAMQKAKVKPDDSLHGDMSEKMPLAERQTSANYNHLMEQPTIFYATCMVIVLAGHVDPTAIWLAWAYVGLRMVHSLIQITYHKVLHRFLVFVTSSIVLIVLVVRELIQLFA